MKLKIRGIVATLLMLFALLTLFLSTSVIFDLFGIRLKEGNYVLFVVWSNFICSILYLISVYGLLKVKEWTYKILSLSSLILLLTFIAFLLYIQSGGIHETKTFSALIFRTSLTIIFALYAYTSINRKMTTLSHEN